MAHPLDYFVPGEPDPVPPPVARLWSPIPPGVAQSYVEAYTAPGDDVLLPYCQGADEAREVLVAGRRALAASYDPLALLVAADVLWPCGPRDLDAAVARLGDSLKQGVPFRHALGDLYATACPACQRAASADHFLWDRDQGRAVARWVRCPECGWDGQTSLDAEDEARMKAVPERGMHYHYILDRVAPEEQDGGLRSRMEPLLKLYSPRSLYALAEIAMRIDALAPGPAQRALRTLLLECLRTCSSLAPVPGTHPLPQAWTRPARYLERNVWRAFEEAASRRGAPVPGLAPRLAASVQGFYAQEALPVSEPEPLRPARAPGSQRQRAALEPGSGPMPGFLCQATVRDLRHGIRARSVRLILASPPPLEPAAWPYACLWSGWILGPGPTEPLRALLRQRSPDIAWYSDTMGRSLAALDDLLSDDGRLILILSDQRPAVAEAIALAAARAHLGVASIHQSGSSYRLELAPALARPVPRQAREPSSPALRARPGDVREPTQPAVSAFVELEQGIEQAARAAAAGAIRARGEPVPWAAIHGAVLRALSGGGWLSSADEALVNVASALSLLGARIKAALDHPDFDRMPVTGVEGDLWWLAGGEGRGSALADLLEAAAFQVLSGSGPLTQGAFSGLLFQEFAGDRSPEPDLVGACLKAYAVEMPPGRWQLRSEDRPGARAAESASIVEGLIALGRRLGYRPGVRPPFDVAWYRAGQMQAVFAVRSQALLGELLPLAEAAPGVQPYLVLPGSRSPLVSLKLARNPLWQRRVDEAGWRFVKYRHVRDLFEQPDADEYALRTIVGLDPIVERETVQLALF